jgi:hypothetical protein
VLFKKKSMSVPWWPSELDKILPLRPLNSSKTSVKLKSVVSHGPAMDQVPDKPMSHTRRQQVGRNSWNQPSIWDHAFTESLP